ncbi:YtxH domain-containing protein [Staphylococcus sp. 17KM0847]|uniref:YtxH domain-containing protein n=1 Tax=Staphylococcus sp. 17KM0847 TaxID=2583989 RepID=UPI0015DD1958|nr:YtxH domain-containing protein [Staphylococcus sp. 17KM0847]QLK86288.1 YtxH domain-containing protein [Staphylococcus sp. 17KM0847]
MAKSSKLLRAVIGIGGAAAAVALSNKERRDKLKKVYNDYKDNPEEYKRFAQDKASQLGSVATDEINKVKENPKGYVENVKQNPKAFLNEKKEQLLQKDNVSAEHTKESDFVAEGGGDVTQNLNDETINLLKQQQK